MNKSATTRQHPAVDQHVRDVLTARVYDVAIESPLERADKLSTLVDANVYLKREDLQPVHSFKLRGAYNKICQLSNAEQRRGVITASAGNHAQGVALAAQKLGLSALIIMPRTTPSIKIDAVRSYGAQIELYGDSYSEAADYCKQRVAETGRTYIHPFDDPLVIAGQGTIAREILEQLPETTHIFVPVGGGGLIAGIAGYVKAIRPDVRVIGVEPTDSNCMGAAIQADERITLSHVGIFADGVAVKQVGANTFAAAKAYVDDFVTVTTDQICAGVKDIYEATRSIVEPSGALAVAALKQYKLPANSHAVAICSGANVTFERLQQIAERTLLGSGSEALLAVDMPEQAGALSQFCRSVVHDRAITEFSYRLRERRGAHVFMGIAVADQADHRALLERIHAAGYACTDLSGDDITKEHARHMVGGEARAAGPEAFYHVDFPERPGALSGFLSALDNRWNISLFHYRSAASDTGRVLIGFEATNLPELEQSLNATGFAYANVTDDRALRLFCSARTP